MHQPASVVKDPDAVIDPQSRATRRTQQKTTVWTPFADACVGRIEARDLFKRLSIPDVDRAVEVTEAGKQDETTLRIVRYKVARKRAQILHDVHAMIKDDCFRRHDCAKVRQNWTRNAYKW